MSVFITFEGIEGCGKSTQAKRCLDFLVETGRDVMLTREPGGTRIGDAIREILLAPGNRDMVPTAELFLYYASRAQHVAEVIRPALNEGKLVLCDRFHDATTAYQGYGRGISLELIRHLNAEAAAGCLPDLTILLDCDPEVGLARVGQRTATSGDGSKDRLEREDLAFHRRVREGYLEIAREEPRRVVVVDASAGESEVADRVFQVLRERLQLGNGT